MNRRFHTSLLATCPSQRRLALCAILFHQAERYRRFSAHHRVSSRSKDREHRRLLEAVLKRDADTSCALLAEYMQSTQRTWMRR